MSTNRIRGDDDLDRDRDDEEDEHQSTIMLEKFPSDSRASHRKH